jgi:hypothetical protein
LKQGTDDNVDEYAAKFIKLIKRCEVTDEAQKKRMFLFGLNLAYVTFIQMGNHETLEAMISGAKKIKAGFNLSTGRIGSKNKKKEETKESEIDALTKQINQLNTNYADLVTAFLAQKNEASSSTQRFQSRNNQNQRNRPPPRDKRDVTCYACGKQGHYARDCRSRRNDGNNKGNNNRRDDNRRSNNFDRNNNFNRGRSQTRFVLPTGNRSLNYNDQYEEEEYYYNDYYTDEEAESYVATRATERNNKAPYTPKYSESLREQALQNKTTVAEQKKPRRKLMPAPIERVDEFNVADYVGQLPSGLSVGQAVYLIPKYRTGLAAALRRTKEAESNYANQPSKRRKTTAMKCEIMIGKEPVTAVIDSGAAASIVTDKLMKRLGYTPTGPSGVVVVTTSGVRVKPLGVIKDFPISVNHLKMPTTIEVLESTDQVLLLGNDWLYEVGAIVNWRKGILTVHHNGRDETVNCTCLNEGYAQYSKYSVKDIIPNEDNEEEYKQTDDEEALTYYSDLEIEEYFNYNAQDWLDEEYFDHCENPAIYLAQFKQPNQNEKWNLKKDVQVGPLDQHQHELFQQMLAQNADICSESQMDIGRTNVLKHSINTESNAPYAH